MSGNDMRYGTDLASPGANQRRETWLKEPPGLQGHCRKAMDPSSDSDG